MRFVNPYLDTFYRGIVDILSYSSISRQCCMTSAWKIRVYLPGVTSNSLKCLGAVIAYVQYFSAEVARKIDARCAFRNVKKR